MSNRPKNLLLGAALPLALLLFPICSFRALANARTSAALVLETCRAAMDDLAKVDVIARERNWTALTKDQLPALQQSDLKLRSAWNVTQGSERFVVVTGTGEGGNICMVTFMGMKLLRDEFFSAMSSALELKLVGNMDMPPANFRIEIFEIKSEPPARQILELMSSNGDVMQVGIMDAPSKP